ncbi:unnamed protein product [Ostreobium quekettii]|uniref:Tyrosine specific protein phosphatases domain-containing protein n=1 Tax=Ostreobium quekettii TaxID=121088 RepID=A0A8S1JGL5_9CHLO|nr:unnamed protein product [Ostreobium quekettii]|eukprot:evm.model.scf_328.5 EVM.evm.TU.scf_328.5   scf_328:52288-54655(+)
MPISLVVGSAALIPTALGIALRNSLHPAAKFVLAHIAATGFAVSLCTNDYCASKTTRLLGKNDKGQIALWGLALMWPFHLGLRLRLRWKRSITTEPLYNEILPGWYLGGWPHDASCLPPGSPAVLDVTSELPRTQISGEYLCLPTWDTHAPVVPQIEQGVSWALAQRSVGRNVYVHCAHGHGRSVLVLCACLIQGNHAADYSEAIRIIKSRRPRVKMNKRQNAAFQSWMQKRQENDTSKKTK